jgi:hypothetical protein
VEVAIRFQAEHRSLTSGSTDAVLGSRLFYVAGIPLIVPGLFAIGTRPLTGAQLLLAVPGTVCAGLHLVAPGLPVDVRSRLKAGEDGDRGRRAG